MRHRRPAAARRHRAAAPQEGSLTGAARLVGSFPRADAALTPPFPEIAFVGRSNVGKSSLINALVGTRVARVSATPGKTTLLNVYQVGAQSTEHGARPPREDVLPAPCYLLDLPGYGWANASQAARRGYRRLVAGTLSRPGLRGVVWLLDVRHEPSADDRAMQAALATAGLPVLAALTKGDKLPRGRRLARRAALRDALGLADEQVMVTSARQGDGIAELRATVAALARGAAREARDAASA